MTNNIKRRLGEHNSKDSKLATARYRPLELAAYIAVEDDNRAIGLERYFKTGSGKAFLKKRILPDYAEASSGKPYEARHGDYFQIQRAK